MTYVDTSDISAQMFITVLLLLLIIAPLVSLGVLRLFQSKKKSGILLIISGAAVYGVFQVVMSITHMFA
ncbi:MULTISPECIES: hypothetical protein [unclassified Paenibacillus]|uniref:hypothetical protein n=1 Tax=unclassified Paenibacillus TaxID=185978 RepID=UPI0024070C2C|nr:MULTISPECIES: hypothetical protein [unclassified Paenibacillus]MDF9843083.1 uncharacterized membrane protein YhaH (DUF805 family) [Paenibacillus sp. PastF-2]MDF9849705.1 uncharacterized membrane protein YhaH (DUF805 family) [Paenibacillus sp. PastM-2]MDF9856378.1 uncharacterized membrane protein YhaH (DUF805 family) [Paenibacillus sp. PastF-1]MDH6481649.1 uncharacterized membrane protein YhaH (DUF805 family) [Paenibacillus sp. PastH-2]MDH6508931.1 uncharacterized membrane protein YhaH (DUF8